MKISQTILLCFFILPYQMTLRAENIKPSLIPLPGHVEWREGTFVLSQSVELISNADNLRTYFIEQIHSLAGVSFKTISPKSAADKIIFKVEPQPTASHTEAYRLSVSNHRVEIVSPDEEGLFRGIQTFFQLIPASVKTTKKNVRVEIPSCEIVDAPAFKWRGLNLDCGRHFMTKDFIKRYIDILAYYKFNVLHWHLTEDQGWRIEIKKYPKLSAIGAWRTEADGSRYGGYYTQSDIKEIVAYAQSRFISIVPEIEMPGHSLAALASYPENSCTGGPFEVTNIWGVMKDVYCAGRDSTFYFLQDILDEVTGLFPGEYIHIGGDEVPKDKWKECPKCQSRIKTEGLKDEHELQSYFIKRIAAYLRTKGKKIIGWDEILQGGLAEGTLVQSWQSFQGAVEAAKLGHYTVCSPASHTYLNEDPEDLDLRTAYSFNPIPGELSAAEKKSVLGGEANLWTERAPQETVDSKLFPRLLALAEDFWTGSNKKNYDEFYSRVQNAYKDLIALGITYGLESKAMTYSTHYNTQRREFTLVVSSAQKDLQIRYTNNTSEPSRTSSLYKKPIKINTTATVTFAAFKNDRLLNDPVTLSFVFHKALNAAISIVYLYEERYRASGPTALIDGVRGTTNFHDGAWQGYEGVDFEAIIDMGKEQKISKVIPRFMLNATSWIFLPEKVQVAFSNDATNFRDEKEIKNGISQKNPDIVLKDFSFEFNDISARYVKIKAENIRVCPAWHPGAGGKAWLFLDEVVVE